MLVLSGLSDINIKLMNLVDGGESSALFRHLGHDVWGAENGLEVKPGGLHLQPLIKNILYEHQLTLPLPVHGNQLHIRTAHIIYTNHYNIGQMI